MGSGLDGILYGTDSDDDLNIFNVNHDNDERWLNTYNGNPDNTWNPDDRFVVVVPRNSLHFSPFSEKFLDRALASLRISVGRVLFC
jgi:hypothetical protein